MAIRSMTATIAVFVMSGALALNAQTPTPQTTPQQPRTQAPTPQPQTEQPRAQMPQTDQQRAAAGTQARGNAGERILTLTGCLQAEKDVPGRRESATERAGMGEDYILTNVKMSQGASTSGIGLGPMYQVKGGSLNESELKNHLGHQVELTGSIENNSDIRGGLAGRSDSPTDSSRATTAAGNSNLPNFEATSLKMIAATCQAQ
jgi:hypothetical protein